MNIAYIRVSSIDQNEERQIECIKSKYNIDKWYIDKCSGKDTNRPKLQELLQFVRCGDVVIVHEFSRLARNTQDLLNLVKEFKERDITLISNKDNIDTSTAIGEFMLTVIGAINQLERQQIRERQLEGIKIAKEQHKFDKKPIKASTLARYIDMIDSKEITKVKASKELNVSRVTLDRLIREFRESI